MKKVLEFMKGKLKSLGVQTVYSVLLLYYAYKSTNTPSWARNIILGALGYLLTPIDSIPDLTPFLGFTDDIGVISFGLVTIACYIDDNVKLNARKQLEKYYKGYTEEMISEVDAKL